MLAGLTVGNHSRSLHYVLATISGVGGCHAAAVTPRFESIAAILSATPVSGGVKTTEPIWSASGHYVSL